MTELGAYILYTRMSRVLTTILVVSRSTRPFLSLVEKKWISFQLLTALRDARMRKVAHGDIKSENILVTSWNWVYVSDFASSFKPVYLPLNDPSDFAFYYDTAGRRTCYLAPERFYTAEANPEISARKAQLAGDASGDSRRDGKVTEAMDVFSAGCVLAELFAEGKPLFSLAQLFKYRARELSVEPQLSSIEDVGMRVRPFARAFSSLYSAISHFLGRRI
jgi:phosphoinositide-3-kinase, regulatory subunit 4